jgi:Flp pilus assembly protein TadG
VRIGPDRGDAVRGSRLRRRSGQGQALVEFALVFPVLVLILLGIFEVGRLVFAYNTLGNAAREGARVAAVNQIEISPDCTNNRPIVNPATPHWSIKQCAADKALSLGLTDANVDVQYSAPPGVTWTCSPTLRVGCLATVTVEHEYRAITPIIGDILGPIGLEAVSEMPIERVFP